MPTKTETVEAELFMEHQGVKVYHTYIDDDMDQGENKYDFTLHELGVTQYGDDGVVFDVRQLPTWKAPVQPPFTNEVVSPSMWDRCVKQGLITREEREKAVKSNTKRQQAKLEAMWRSFHESVEPGAIQAAIKEAIEKGFITQDLVLLREKAPRVFHIRIETTESFKDKVLAGAQQLLQDAVGTVSVQEVPNADP